VARPAPSDFYLFGKLKQLLMGKSFGSDDDILAEINGLLKNIGREKLDSVFENWERRLPQCIAINGE
jgi:hypothetical protein